VGLYLGIDIGTTEIAAIALDAATGRAIANTSAPEPAPHAASPGRSEWDATAMIARALQIGHAAVAATGQAGEFAGIGVTGQQHGGVLVSVVPGDELRPLGPFIGWQDKRGDEPTADDHSTVAWLHRQVGAAALARTGCRVASGFLGTTLCWLARQGQLPSTPVRAAFIADLLVAHLCAQALVTDPTNAGGAGLFDAVAGDWDGAMLGALGLPPHLFPPVRPTGAIVGQLATAAATALGLRAGVPVMNGLGDNQASFFGSVGGSTADVLVNVGTGGQVSAIAAGFVRGPLLETRPYLDGTYLLVGGGIVGGRAYALLRDFIRQTGRDCFATEGADDLYPALNALAAAAPPGADGLRCDPRFGGNRYDADQRGAFTGLDERNFTPGHLARALLEGTARVFSDLYGTMLTVGLTPRARLIGSGNGIRRNPLLADLIGDAFGLPLVTPRHTEEAAHGAALLAAVATGEITMVEATARLSYGATAA